jgi:hypothetical protein
MNEVLPPVASPIPLAAAISGQSAYTIASPSFTLDFDVHPGESGPGRLAVSFLPAHGDHLACEFQIGLADRRAQFGSTAAGAFAPSEKSLREGGAPEKAFNYAVENLLGTDKPFAVRIIVKYSPKIGGSLIDAEIAGCRTMISHRPELSVARIGFRTDAAGLSGVQLAELVGG